MCFGSTHLIENLRECSGACFSEAQNDDKLCFGATNWWKDGGITAQKCVSEAHNQKIHQKM